MKDATLYVPGIRAVDEHLRLYTARQAAAVLGVHEGTVRRWMDEGHIKFKRPGKRRMISRKELERLAT